MFVRNDLFEQVIKSCKATSIEFLMFKEKLRICLYKEIYYEVENIQIEDDIEGTDKEPIEVIDKVSNKKSTKKLTKELIEESDKESNTESNKELAKKIREVLNKYSDDLDKIDETFKESNKEPNEELNKESNKEMNKESNKQLIQTISLKNDENTTNCYDKNKFNKTLTTIDGNNFNHQNKIGKFRFNDINNLLNNIKNNTISEADTKNKINELNEIKKVETKAKRLIKSQEKLLGLFDNLVEAILNNNNNNNNNNNESESENESVN